MNLTSISAFQDNYIWVLSDEKKRCLIVDPGEAAPVLSALEDNQWQPEAILLTHHHQDHVGGVAQLRERYPQLPVYGPEETRDKGATELVYDGTRMTLLGLDFQVIATPGHTLGHICWYAAPWLFCGDTLFSGGCGRLFEGTAAQMFASLKKLNALPADTLICCAHEYTLSNIKFALSILPEDRALKDYYRDVSELRAKNEKTLPTILKNERAINLFLRTEDSDLIKKFQKKQSCNNLNTFLHGYGPLKICSEFSWLLPPAVDCMIARLLNNH